MLENFGFLTKFHHRPSRTFSFKTASNGLCGLELLASLEFDLLVTDYDMPTMGGLRLILECRENDLSLPIVMVTGRVDIDDQEIFRAGASALLEKPFSCSELNSIVESLLR
jgi:CheY-like chemotaxis protein